MVIDLYCVVGRIYGAASVRSLKVPFRPISTYPPHRRCPWWSPESSPPVDPAKYELLIDNDSGTYRPNKDLIPVFRGFLKRNLPGLKIVVMACDDDKLQKMKDEQRKTKLKEGDGIVYGQGSVSSLASGSNASISSSDQESLNERARIMQEGRGDSAPSGGILEKGVEALENPKDTLTKAMGKEKQG